MSMGRTMRYLLDGNVLPKISFPFPVVESFACHNELYDNPEQSPQDRLCLHVALWSAVPLAPLPYSHLVADLLGRN